MHPRNKLNPILLDLALGANLNFPIPINRNSSKNLILLDLEFRRDRHQILHLVLQIRVIPRRFVSFHLRKTFLFQIKELSCSLQSILHLSMNLCLDLAICLYLRFGFLFDVNYHHRVSYFHIQQQQFGNKWIRPTDSTPQQKNAKPEHKFVV